MSRWLGFGALVLAGVVVSSFARADAFSEDQGRKELTAARVRATECSKVSGVHGPGKMKITIGNNGQVSEIVMLSVPPRMDEATDQCIRAEFQKIRVTPFEGLMPVISGGFMLP